MADTAPTPSSPITYAEALRRLLSLADYERMAGLASPTYKHDLSRMRDLASRMGDPQRCVRAVHIAGTKGKGSVAAMVTSILKAVGLRTVTFTSPHLHTFRERIQVDGEPCTEEQFALAVERVWPHVEAMANLGGREDSVPRGSSTPSRFHRDFARNDKLGDGPRPDDSGWNDQLGHGRPTTFEALTAMAFDMARMERADVQVVEVGLGGRLDSTNVVEAAVSVITSISLDHTAILGDTVEAIAAEKAGIIKEGTPVVVAPQQPGAMRVVETTARRQGAPLVRVGRDVTWEAGHLDLTGQELAVRTPRGAYDLWLPLLGGHQRENAAVAVAAAEALDMGITPEQVAAGMRKVRWDGRFQVLSTSPHVIVDGAHNADSMRRLCETVHEYLPSRRVIAVFGCSADKNTPAMVDQLASLAEHVIVSASHHPRATDPGALRAAFERAGATCETAADVASALDTAKGRAGNEGVVLVTGSLFVAAEALEAWYGIPGERYPEFDPHRTAVPRGKQ